MRRTLTLLMLAAACGGGSSTEPTREPSIAFDQATYTVQLNAAGTAVVSKPTPVLTITRGSYDLPPIIILNLDPAGYCNVGPGVGFPYGSIQKTLQGNEPSAASVTQPIDFNVCPATTGTQAIPKGTTTIHATYGQGGKTYTASATVVVQ